MQPLQNKTKLQWHTNRHNRWHWRHRNGGEVGTSWCRSLYFFLFCFVASCLTFEPAVSPGWNAIATPRRDDDSDEWSHFLFILRSFIAPPITTIWPGPFCLFGQYQQTHKPYRSGQYQKTISLVKPFGGDIHLACIWPPVLLRLCTNGLFCLF